MTAMNIGFTDTESAAVRRAADAAGVPVGTFVRDAVLDRAEGRRAKVRDAAALVAQRSRALDSRLA